MGQRTMGRNGSTVPIVTLLLSLVAALAGLWNGSQLAKLTGQVEALQEIPRHAGDDPRRPLGLRARGAPPVLRGPGVARRRLPGGACLWRRERARPPARSPCVQEKTAVGFRSTRIPTAVPNAVVRPTARLRLPPAASLR